MYNLSNIATYPDSSGAKAVIEPNKIISKICEKRKTKEIITKRDCTTDRIFLTNKPIDDSLPHATKFGKAFTLSSYCKAEIRQISVEGAASSDLLPSASFVGWYSDTMQDERTQIY